MVVEKVLDVFRTQGSIELQRDRRKERGRSGAGAAGDPTCRVNESERDNDKDRY